MFIWSLARQSPRPAQTQFQQPVMQAMCLGNYTCMLDISAGVFSVLLWACALCDEPGATSAMVLQSLSQALDTIQQILQVYIK